MIVFSCAIIYQIKELNMQTITLKIEDNISKKINLSKRLVEEYTHKEVLSKTFT